MFSLNLKIPPPVMVIIAAVFMWLLSVFLPTEAVFQFRMVAVAVLACIGLFFATSGILLFKKVATTVNPTTPDKASSLVIVGLYKVTRNPMYLGLFFILAAWAVFLLSLYSVVILIIFVLYMTQFQIKPEEEALKSLFGDDYLSYKKSVRRWI